MSDISLRTDEIIKHDLDKYGDTIFRLAYSYMKNTYDAEDVVQEVFLKLFENIEMFQNEGHKKFWLIRVGRNVCKNKLKSFWFKKNCELHEVSYYDKYEYKDKSILNEVINLPVKYREVIYLYYYEGYT